jgi:hypothetical protein
LEETALFSLAIKAIERLSTAKKGRKTEKRNREKPEQTFVPLFLLKETEEATEEGHERRTKQGPRTRRTSTAGSRKQGEGKETKKTQRNEQGKPKQKRKREKNRRERD